MNYKFLDPYNPSSAIDITNNSFTDGIDDENFIITKSNKKIYIKENNVWVKDGLKDLKDDTFEQILNGKDILPTFKTIQNMLKEIIDNNEHREDDEYKLVDGKLFKVSKNNEENEVNFTLDKHDRILSYKQLSNDDFVLVTEKGISIHKINEISSTEKRCPSRV